MKTVASTTFTSSSKQRKVNFFSSPFSRYCTAKKILAIGVNTRVFVLFYGLIRRACKFSVNFTVNRLNAFVYTLGIKRRHMKTVASTTFTSSSKQRKVNFFSSPFSRYCTAKKILAIGVNTRVFVLFYGLIRRACKFSVNFTVNRLNAFVYTLGIKRRHMKTVASTTFTSSSKQRKVNFFSSPFSRYCTAKKILAIGVNTRVFVLFYGLIRRACKFSVNFYGSCKDHFKPLFNPHPPYLHVRGRSKHTLLVLSDILLYIFVCTKYFQRLH